MNVANKALPRSSKYMGRSATFIKTKSRLISSLSKSLDREAILAETFKYTHTLKSNKERFTDKQSVAHYEDYTQRLEVAIQQSQLASGNDEADSETSVVDPNRVWRETASEPQKNRRFGLGSFFAIGLRSSALTTSSASAISPVDPQEFVDLREEVQKLTQELHQ
ncbi:uncharacterized protein DS421_15g500180 [Arachis hypogaea]|uniref:Uncharacterized protein n=1 Tax=Arachis hypogaea TaxID=3818 RepID=A0A444Z697_ARAHY|nr:uncharacterized protein DS421_15g500180 [Arachis hypogaea]RYR09691.1 hypothetical protein Ahy_B05g078071 [Arachis hypogaea]